MNNSIANLCIGDAVRVLSTGYLAARQYIGLVGKLDHIERTTDGKVVAYHVEFSDNLIIASSVETVRHCQLCAEHYKDGTDICDDGMPVESPHRATKNTPALMRRQAG